MSRYTATANDGKHVAYGYDHALGYFIQVYDPCLEEPILDQDSVFGGLTGAKLAMKLRDLGITSKHESYMLLDLPI